MTEGTLGPTAFVLAGGGTKGSFEVGALQYLVGMERIIPDIMTATSAGAIAATVLAQARTHAEFAQRVQEIEDDIVAMTRTEHVFGEQAWLRALKGTALGRSVQFAVTEGTAPSAHLERGHAGVRDRHTDRWHAFAAGPAQGRPQTPTPAPAPDVPHGRRGGAPSAPGPPAGPHQRELGAQPRTPGRRSAPRRSEWDPPGRPGPRRPARAWSCAWPWSPCGPESCAT